MHPCDGFFDCLVRIFQTALGSLGATAHLVRWRVSHALEVHHLVLGDALLAQGLVVTHTKHIDRRIMFRANSVLL